MTHRSSKVSCNTLDDSKALVRWKSIVRRGMKGGYREVSIRTHCIHGVNPITKLLALYLISLLPKLRMKDLFLHMSIISCQASAHSTFQLPQTSVWFLSCWFCWYSEQTQVMYACCSSVWPLYAVLVSQALSSYRWFPWVHYLRRPHSLPHNPIQFVLPFRPQLENKLYNSRLLSFNVMSMMLYPISDT